VEDVEEIREDVRHFRKNALPLPGFLEKAGAKAYSFENCQKT
jgi:hypothetical protein